MEAEAGLLELNVGSAQEIKCSLKMMTCLLK